MSSSLWDEFSPEGDTRIDHLQGTDPRFDENKRLKKYFAVGLAATGGALAIGLTGGIAAPLIGVGVSSVLGSLGVGGSIAAGLIDCP